MCRHGAVAEYGMSTANTSPTQAGNQAGERRLLTLKICRSSKTNGHVRNLR
jgi:hypothetical protein